MIGWGLEWLARVTLGLRGDHFQMAPVLPMWRWGPIVLRFENLWPYTTNNSLLSSWILHMSQPNNPCFETFTTASLKQTLQVELVPISSGHLCGLCGLCGLCVAGTEFVSWHNGNQAVYFEHVSNICTGDNCNTCGSVLASLSARGQNSFWNIHMSHVFQTYSQHVHAISNILAVISHVWVDVKVYISTTNWYVSSSMKLKSHAVGISNNFSVKASTCIANIRVGRSNCRRGFRPSSDGECHGWSVLLANALDTWNHCALNWLPCYLAMPRDWSWIKHESKCRLWMVSELYNNKSTLCSDKWTVAISASSTFNLPCALTLLGSPSKGRTCRGSRSVPRFGRGAWQPRRWNLAKRLHIKVPYGNKCSCQAVRLAPAFLWDKFGFPFLLSCPGGC